MSATIEAGVDIALKERHGEGVVQALLALRDALPDFTSIKLVTDREGFFAPEMSIVSRGEDLSDLPGRPDLVEKLGFKGKCGGDFRIVLLGTESNPKMLTATIFPEIDFSKINFAELLEGATGLERVIVVPSETGRPLDISRLSFRQFLRDEDLFRRAAERRPVITPEMLEDLLPNTPGTGNEE